jgi:sarcosine oxidase
VTQCDVLVVGLGVMGGAVTHHLARRGLGVIGLDRFRVPHAQGSSHGESRNFRQASYESPAYVPLALRAFELWRELEAGADRPLLRLTGRVMLGRPEGSVLRGALAAASDHGLPVEVLAAGEVRRRYPPLRPTDDMIGVFEARAGMLFAEACVEAQLDAARRQGADLRFEERVIEWRPRGAGVEVMTSAGRYAAGHLVLAAGGWLPDLMPALRLEVERQVLLWFEPRERAEELTPERFPTYLWELSPDLSIYDVPLWGDGLKMARHHGGEICTMETVRRTVDDRDVEPVRRALEPYLPAAFGRFLRGRVCVYTNTPDRHFLIDRHPEHQAVIVVSPCSGHGFKYAPAIGEAVAQLLVDGESPQDLSPFQLGRLRR